MALAATYMRNGFKRLAPARTYPSISIVPYCDRLCWFCACHTKHTLKYEPITLYLESLYREIARVGELVDRGAKVSAVHLGGGSPTMLKPDDMIALMAVLRSAFSFRDDAEISR